MHSLIRLTRIWTHQDQTREGECYVNPGQIVTIRPTHKWHTGEERNVTISDVTFTNGTRWNVRLTAHELARLVLQAQGATQDEAEAATAPSY